MTIAVLFILGILLGQRLPLSPGPLFVILIATLVLAGITFKVARRQWTRLAILIIVVIGGALRGQLASPFLSPSHYLTQRAFGVGRFRTCLIDDPSVLGQQGKGVIELQAIWRGDRWVDLTGKARVVSNPRWVDQSSMGYGDVLEIVGTLEPPEDTFLGPTTRLKAVWAAEGVHGVLRPTQPVQVFSRSSTTTIHGALYGLRQRISGLLDKTHPPEVASFIRSILLGLRELPPDQLADFRVTGTYHLLSLSGGHVGILAIVVLAFVSLLPLSRRTRGALVIAVLAGYAIMTGESPGVLRASLMASIFIVGQMLHRPTSIYTSLAFSALLLLLIHPLHIFLPGFQLSFLAVLSIAYLAPPLMTRLDFLPPYLNSLISTSLGASLGTAPILALSFGELSLISPLANLLAIPLFGIILPVALLAVVGSLISPWVPFFFGAANFGFVTLLTTLVHLLALVPCASIDVTDVSSIVWVLYSMALIILGDYQNLRETLMKWLRIRKAEPAPPTSEEIDADALARTAKELSCLLPAEDDASDPISQRLAAVRGMIKGQTYDLAPEFLMRCDALMEEPWAKVFDPLTIAYLGLAEAYFVASRSPDKGPALLLLLKALEHELNVHLFGVLRRVPGLSRAGVLLARYPNHPLVTFLASPPRNLTLDEQNELLWATITHQERALKALERAVRRGLSQTLANVAFFLDPSQFPLRLDQVYKRFYLRLDKEIWDWEGVRRAREEILGPKQENLFQLIGEALGGPKSCSSEGTNTPSPRCGCGGSDKSDPDSQSLECLAWDQRSEAS